MRKLYFTIIFIFLTLTVYAFEGKGDAMIRVFPNEPPLSYDFFYVDLNSIEDIISLGLWIGSWEHMYTGLLIGVPRRVIKNNRELSPLVREKMKQLGANICTTSNDDLFYFNLLLPNGTYTTIIYEPSR